MLNNGLQATYDFKAAGTETRVIACFQGLSRTLPGIDLNRSNDLLDRMDER
jgi:hypothetical protein